MNKIIKISAVFSLFFSFLFLSCPDAVWSGITYEGRITESDSHKGSFYFDYYNIYCPGNWEFSFTSKDNIRIFMEGYDLNGDLIFVDEEAQNSTNTFTVFLYEQTEIDIYVNDANPDWAANGYSAGYSLTATLK